MAKAPYNQTGDYIPRQDAHFLDWCNNFAQQTAIKGAQIGLSADEVHRIELWAQRFADAYQPAQSPEDRTIGTVRKKKDLRKEVETILREYAQRIKHTTGVTYADLIELGVHVDDSTKTRIGPPINAPRLQGKFAPSGGHILRYHDESTPNALRKPYGVVLIQVYAHIGDTMCWDVSKASELGRWGRQPIRIQWTPSEFGKTVSYFGRWMTKNGLVGPWSLPHYLMVAGGGDMHEYPKQLRDRSDSRPRETRQAA